MLYYMSGKQSMWTRKIVCFSNQNSAYILQLSFSCLISYLFLISFSYLPGKLIRLQTVLALKVFNHKPNRLSSVASQTGNEGKDL